MEIERVRQDYPHTVQVFKNSRFPPELLTGLAAALDDFEDRPIIVRSSSLLEDRIGAAFSGKYKSLFLANQGSKERNQGSKERRLVALQDAIAEVYASVFGPDPVEYRAERGLLDFREEMGILIQEVVGKRVGDYFMPACAGVAFSNNDYRWSPRIKREDGLVRMVPGLGTRAVDRMSDDYPVLLAPGQPGLRANATADEIARYSPRWIDVINLRKNVFETVDVVKLLRQCGDEFPSVRKLISVVDQDRIRAPLPLEPDWEHDDFVVTFEGLIADGQLVHQINTMLRLLHEKLGTPVDIEFAYDGEEFYLVQCRAQSYSREDAPSPIPQDISRDRIVFSATRHISNGRVPDITHIVYVDPEHYGEISDLLQLKNVGRAIGRLNQLLPKRQFILMGPGRWGSRGDIRLGVPVTYSDISNTAVLLEVARQKGKYVPELSFGTHFFQDLVEAGIRYLPLYPDDPGIEFNETFLARSGNILNDLLPEFSALADVIHVIDVPRETDGLVLRVLMNAELEQAIGLLDEPTTEVGTVTPPVRAESTPSGPDLLWHQGHVRLREHQERHGRPGKRHRPDRARRRRPPASPNAVHLAGGMEPGPRRDELPPHGVQVGRPARRGVRDRSGHRGPDQLRRQDRGGHRRRPAAGNGPVAGRMARTPPRKRDLSPGGAGAASAPRHLESGISAPAGQALPRRGRCRGRRGAANGPFLRERRRPLRVFG
jgi:hypothetical protein